MFARVKKLADGLEAALADVEPGRYSGEDAAALVELCSRVERLGAAGRTLFAARAGEARVWRRQGYRTPAEWLAKKTGTALGPAIDTLKTAERLEDLADTREAFVKGELSEAQAKEVAKGATADPSAERALLETAKRESVKTLREKVQRIEAAVAPDELAEREREIHKARYARKRTERDGAFHLEVRGTLAEGARLWAAMEAGAEEVFKEAYRAGRREPHEAYLFDALVALVDAPAGESDGPGAMVHLRMDAGALKRGLATGDEAVEVAGLGPISLPCARSLLGDSILEILVKKGKDVVAATSATRTIPPSVRSAVAERDRVCVVPGCDVGKGLEFHHWQVPFAEGGPSEEWNLCRVCRFHHKEVTYGRLVLRDGPGAWESGVVGAERSPPGDGGGILDMVERLEELVGVAPAPGGG